MATINNKLIHFKSKSDFDGRYAESTDGGKTYGDFLGTSIVFIQDAKQIWTHGQFYDANEATLASLGITATAAELNYVDGVTSNIQSQLNEIKESVDSISDPYEINLTNLLSAEDSESISTAIGGIDNLNATVQDNRIIVGTISNGNVSVSIRILGNVTTLYYLLDSVVGLTLNEVAITNTSGTLSKNVTTHSVITENMVINSLTSDETTLPLSAAQGKVLATDKQSKTDNNLSTEDKTVVGAINELKEGASGSGNGVYYLNGFGNINLIDYDNLENVKQSIQTAIGGLDNFVQALQDGKSIIDKVIVGGTPTDIPWSGFRYSVMSQEDVTGVMITADNPLTCRFGDELLREKLFTSITNITITNERYEFMIQFAEFKLESTSPSNIASLLKSYFYDYFYAVLFKQNDNYRAMCTTEIAPITINGAAYNFNLGGSNEIIIIGCTLEGTSTQRIEEYKLDLSTGSISNSFYTSCGNILCMPSEELAFWRSQTEGTISGTFDQRDYNTIKKAIEEGFPISIRIPYSDGHYVNFQSVSSSKGSVEGEYIFCYLDCDPTTNNFFIKWFKVKSDLTCQVYTKIL